MGYIGPLWFDKLKKEWLRVRFQGKKMFQCLHCALLKIFKQISWIPHTNKTTWLFYQVFIDWLDLKKGSDSYQGDKAIVC